MDELLDILLLTRHNTRTVVLGVTGLGASAGVVGAFLLLRKRALLGDALSHATLPGVVLAFMLCTLLGVGRPLWALLAGAAASGLVGVGVVLALRRGTRLKEDAALGIVLSVFFGLGVLLLGWATRMPGAASAGLTGFIFGKTASMVTADARAIGLVAVAVGAGCVLLYKEFKLLCFDEAFAGAIGRRTLLLDVALMVLVTAVTVVGLQAVGAILVIALLVIPAAAARFWTERLGAMLGIAGGIGAASGWGGAAASAALSDLPAGAVIVLVASGLFAGSMVLGRRRGLVAQWLGRRRLARRVLADNLMRALYEHRERTGEEAMTAAELTRLRTWRGRTVRAGLRRLRERGLLGLDEGVARLTPAGVADGERVTRNHRLWEMYLIRHADVAPSHVDRGADRVEHALGPELVRKLEDALRAEGRSVGGVPATPHVLEGAS